VPEVGPEKIDVLDVVVVELGHQHADLLGSSGMKTA